MNKLFGTDGIRGEVGKYPLTPQALFTLGRTLGIWLKEKYPQKDSLKIALGKDTRASGDELEIALLSGAQSLDIRAIRLGVCPTPAVAYLARVLGAQMGLAISASHNPGSDNGIKFFDAEGYKLLPLVEEQIEQIFFTQKSQHQDCNIKLENISQEKDCSQLYLNFIKEILSQFNLSNLRVVVDCACGSFSEIAPKLFQELRATVFAINNRPDGNNINANCGTLHPQAMSAKVLQEQADLGVAFDGDGDRLIVADERGNILDGDQILAILTRYLYQKKRLKRNSIVSTEMSNIGLELCLRKLGVKMIRTKVGDKYILEQMLKEKINLGGEQSGHIILLDNSTTGDGLIIAAELIKIMLENKTSLSRLAQDFQKYPQVLVNVKVSKKKPLEEIPGYNDTFNRAQKQLGSSGRIFVRYSGTENLARIMVEGSENSLVSAVADSLAGIIENELGENKCS
ncbi:MAG: phosphoglucosamine mutase [Candidatus Omnitrophica bacterium]|nr:phosphoglucosamine mutase [Candidatus Omnitrophota bacterium]